ncbi:TPA: hypothetical protein I7212_23355 [Vibrio vulnificus]|nr:hypothetical protein [Vibrio vulnificus]
MENGKIFLDKRKSTTYIRKRLWNKEKKGYDQDVLVRYPTYGKPPAKLEQAIIDQFKLTENELEQYDQIVAKIIKEDEESSKRVTKNLLERYLNDAIEATKTIEDVEKMGVDRLDVLANLASELKKQLNQHKNKLKKRKS